MATLKIIVFLAFSLAGYGEEIGLNEPKVLLYNNLYGSSDLQDVMDFMKDYNRRLEEQKRKYQEKVEKESIRIDKGKSESESQEEIYKGGSKKSKVNDYYHKKKFSKKTKMSGVDPEVISWALDPTYKPMVNFTVDSSSKLFRIEVDTHNQTHNYMISVALERMNCRKNYSEKISLVIEGESDKTFICKEIDNALNYFQSVVHISDGDKVVNVTGTGDWTGLNVSATLVASIYYEPPSCHVCEMRNGFCCNSPSTSCHLPIKRDVIAPISVQKGHRQSTPVRCIPKEDGEGNSLLCNNHPNCGLHCNADELRENCPKDKEEEQNDYFCPGYYCREYPHDKFLVTVLILVVFCVFVPFCIFLFLCNRRELRSEFGSGRCPLPLEIAFCPFSMSADPPERAPPTINRSTRTGIANGARRPHRSRNSMRLQRRENNSAPVVNQAGVNNFSYLDDLPPSYAECYGNKELYPNPPGSVPTISSTQDNPTQRMQISQNSSSATATSQETDFSAVDTQVPDNRESTVCQCSRHRLQNLAEIPESERQEGAEATLQQSNITR